MIQARVNSCNHAEYNWRCRVRLWSLRYDHAGHIAYGESVQQRKRRASANLTRRVVE
jgi:hypothetical protein